MKTTSFQVNGFLSAVTKAHIKSGSDREDLGLIVSETPAAAAGVFTRNQVKAASVLIDQERIQAGIGRAILVNSGNANACTGDRGLQDTRTLTRRVAALLAVPEGQVFMASTGVIGQPLPLRRMEQALPALEAGLSPEGLPDVARAIMTTDTFPKIMAQEVTLGKGTGHLVGLVKGAGMIRPDLATMLCFVLTDVAVTAEILNRLLAEAVDQSFNRITVDGDTSTNDLVLVLANGRAGNATLRDTKSVEARSFSRALNKVLLGLAKMIVRDGEGATKQVELIIRGARTAAEARIMGFTVAESPLVKTALFGEDANWGRILAALGRSGIPFDPGRVEVFFDRVQMVGNGLGLGAEAESRASQVLKKASFTITVDLHQGKARASVFTCDLSLDYVKINAHYRT
ncbi:MAG: bifunctional glutamate N-acetyltransferase/amino-acid acetyltransferase ArgJ [Desulfobacterota bacterium]|nr:bifunctional glutamate N-acetyltransferase/amino-acid acetyltransferase ArgJ [Thermodesulfobacteriota bacterium]